jgi:hypothetical protein
LRCRQEGASTPSTEPIVKRNVPLTLKFLKNF